MYIRWRRASCNYPLSRQFHKTNNFSRATTIMTTTTTLFYFQVAIIETDFGRTEEVWFTRDLVLSTFFIITVQFHNNRRIRLKTQICTPCFMQMSYLYASDLRASRGHVMTQLSSIRGHTHKKTDVNLLKWLLILFPITVPLDASLIHNILQQHIERWRRDNCSCPAISTKHDKNHQGDSKKV